MSLGSDGEIGTKIEEALSTIGVTSDRVSRWLGKPCGCKERVAKLNQLGRWAIRVVRSGIEGAEEYLNEIISDV